MSTQTRIPVFDLAPQVEALWEELNLAFQRALRSTHYILGPEVRAFEEEAAHFLGAAHAVGCNSGTDALVLALRALGVGPGDEVITTPFTFFATAEAISQVGATPVFVGRAGGEHEPGPRPDRAGGHPAHPGHPAGAPVRPPVRHGRDPGHRQAARARGGGGLRPELRRALPGPDHRDPGPDRLLQLLPVQEPGRLRRRRAAGHPATPGWRTWPGRCAPTAARKKYHNEMFGYNSRLDELQAALLRVKLPRLETWNEGRRRVARTYRRLLEGLKGIVAPALVEGHVFHQYTIRVPGCDRDRLQARLAGEGVETMVYYPVPCHRLEAYAHSHGHVSCPRAERLCAEVISLPIWPEMAEEDQASVARALAAEVTRG